MREKLLLMILTILFVNINSFAEEPYIGTKYMRVTKEMEIKNYEHLKEVTQSKFTIPIPGTDNLYVYQNLSNAFFPLLNNGNKC